MKKRNRNRNKQLNRQFYVPLLGATLASALALPTISWSQTSEATLRGYATPNSEITARNVATGALRHTTAGSDGGYVLVGLPAGTYRVDAGPGTEQTITLSVASDESLNLGAGGAEVTGTLEEIIVKATRLFETKTSEVADVVELHEIETLPQYTRNFLEFADTVPGMQFQIDSNGNTSLRGGAQLDEAINVFIDGVGQKDYVAQGSGVTGQSGSGQNGDPGNPFPQLAIGEYKVITSNYKAEYGDAASAIIVAQTKSGTNQFQGEAFADFTNQNFRAETPAEASAATGKTKAPSWEYGVAEGGPIIQDVLHFFVTWEHKSLAEQNVVYPGGNVTTAFVDTLGLPTSVTSQFGPTTNPFKEDLAFGKLDFEPTASDRFELTAKLREETQVSGAAGQTATSASQQYKNNDNRWNLLWQHNADRWTNEMRVDYQNTVSTTSSTNDNPQNNYIYFPAAPANSPADLLIQVGGPGSGTGFRYGQTGPEILDDFTLPNLQWAGEHTVKFGARFQAVDLTSSVSSSNLNDASYYWAVTAAGVSPYPFEVQFPQLTQGFGSAGVTTSDKQYGLYLQDDWAINKHLLINAGVRWDYEIVPAYLNFVTPTNVVDAINGPFCGNPAIAGCIPPSGAYAGYSYGQVLAIGGGPYPYPGININNYISTGHNRKAPSNDIAPRLGFSYDINEDGMYVPFGAYGRSYNRNLFGTESLETTKIALNSNPQAYFPNIPNQDDFGACGTAADVNPTNHCYTWNPAYLTPAGLASFLTSPTSHEVDMLNNNLKTPYSDQFSIGFRSKLGDWNTAVTLSDVRSYDTILGHWGGRYNNGQIYQGGAQWGAQGVPGVGSLILWDNGGEDEDLSLGLQLTKPYTRESGWSMTIAYTYSDAFQNNSSGDEAGYIAGYNQYLFDLPYPADYKMLPSVAVPRHRVVVTYSHDLPWNFVVAGKLTLATPIPIDGAYGIPNCPPATNQYNGCTVETSGQPSETLGYRDLDVQVTKNFEISHDITAYIRADVLNVFNYDNFDPTAYIWNQTSTPTFNTTGPIVGFPRTFKLYGGVKW
jgi:outer membrane receptor for ferrienterochelin and colicin